MRSVRGGLAVRTRLRPPGVQAAVRFELSSDEARLGHRALPAGGVLRLGMIEIAVTAVSLKIMFLIHKQGRVNHFQIWILSSLEWRLDQMMKELKSQRE